MNEPARKVKCRIQSARQWLNQAEEHFGRNASARGEMDLLLAEAELRSTRETLHSRRLWFTIGWVQQGTAFALAAVMAVAGAGGAWWWWREQPPSPEPAVAAAPMPVVVPDPVQKISVVAIPQTAPSRRSRPSPRAAGLRHNARDTCRQYANRCRSRARALAAWHRPGRAAAGARRR